MNAPFAAIKSDLTDVPLWRQPEVLDTARSFAWPLGMLALAAMVFFGVIRPAMKSLTQPMSKTGDGVTDVEGREGQLDALEADQPERPQLAGPAGNEPAQPSASELRLEDARKLTRDNPAAVANIVKAWINGEAPA
jgi:flagellar M-ring protein FliF